MTSSGNSLLATIVDAVWPRFCVICKQEGSLLCRACEVAWWHEPPEPTAEHMALFAYANPVVNRLICAWKYEYDLSAFAILTEQSKEFLPSLRKRVREVALEAIVPLPLSGQRFRERGFNQSDMIARWLAQELDLPIASLLKRTHRKGHQAERTTEQRQAAMHNSPFVLNTDQKAPQKILLVDDVWTTGATLTAAKTVLEADQQTQVFCFTLAKG